MPKAGGSRRQIERIVERRKLLILTPIKYEKSGRGKISKAFRPFSIQNTDRLAFFFKILVNMWTSFNPPINFLERTKSSIYEDHLSLVISCSNVLTGCVRFHFRKRALFGL